MRKILLIVDPQEDFITGSLGVMGAKSQLEELANRIGNNNIFDRVIVTLDAHPKDHCSFLKNGGKWPEHCVKYTRGFLPDSYLWDTLTRVFSPDRILVIEKGKNPKKEEYGALDNKDNEAQFLGFLFPDDQIYVSGIMSEYCVLETVKGMVENWGNDKYINILLPAIATMDNHKTLLEYCKEHNKINIIKNYEN